MSKTEPQGVDPAIVDQAIHWLVRLRFNQADEQTQRSFECWLQLRPEHALAWQRVDALNDEFAGIPPGLARQTLNSAKQGIRRRESLKLLGLMATVGGAAWLGRDYTPLPAMLAQQRSHTGEQRRFQLADGTLVQLNSDSAIDSYFDSQRRLLVLRRGEFIAQASNDSEGPTPRPFWVETRDGFMQAMGARFLVRETDHGTLLSVHQGAVTVFPGSSRAPVAKGAVQAGQQLLFGPDGPRPLRDTGLDLWSWSDGVISAKQMRLDDFVAELSRYRTGVLRCSDEVCGLRVSGTFQLDDTDQVLALVAKALPLRVDYRTRYWVTLTAQG